MSHHDDRSLPDGPPLADWLVSLPPRLRDTVTQQAGTAPFAQASALGLAARLAPAPPRPARLDPTAPPAASPRLKAARTWARRQDAAFWEAVDQKATALAEALRITLAELSASFSADLMWRGALWRSLRNRDLLASVAWVAAIGGHPAGWRADLRALDLAGQVALAGMLGQPPLTDRLLAALAAQGSADWWLDPELIEDPSEAEATVWLLPPLPAPVAAPEALAADDTDLDGSEGTLVGELAGVGVRLAPDPAGTLLILTARGDQALRLNADGAVELTELGTEPPAPPEVLTRKPLLWVARLPPTGRIRLRIGGVCQDIELALEPAP